MSGVCFVAVVFVSPMNDMSLGEFTYLWMVPFLSYSIGSESLESALIHVGSLT